MTIGLALCLLTSAAAFGQEPPPLTVEWTFSEEAESVGRVPRFAWTSSEQVLLLDERRPKAERTLEILDAATGKRRPAVDREAALASLKAAATDRKTPESLGWPETLDAAGAKGTYSVGGDVFVLDLAASRFDRLTKTEEPESAARISPDGRRVAYVRGNDLYVYDLGSKAEKRLTTDGTDSVLNGTLSWVYWEEIFDRTDTGYWWSPDSSAIAFLRTDESPVDVTAFTDFAPAVPRVIRQRYPKTGRPNPKVRLGVADLATGAISWMEGPGLDYEYVIGVTWTPDSKSVAVQTTNREQTRLDLWRVARATGRASKLLSDNDDAWVSQKEIQFLPDGGFLATSERTGYTHLYRFGPDGALRNAVTKGDWSVRAGRFSGAARKSAGADGANGAVYFSATEKSPLERHVYRIALDGTGMKRITKEDGTHRVEFSADLRFYVDEHSSHDTPPSLTLHTADGTSRAVIAASSDLPTRLGIAKKEILAIPAADGFPLPASILRATDFDASQKHPVLLHVYGGPGAPMVQDRWDRDRFFDEVLARRGYVVVSVDPRSATGQSKALERLVAGHLMGDLELNDLVAGVKWLKSQPWADPAKFGIWGWSGGGSYTLLALTRSQEFAAGISGAPVTDWTFYDTKFGESVMRTKETNPEGYAQTSFLSRAKDLHGRLLLIFGTYDDNVHPQNEYAFMDALIAAGKPFDLMTYPMRKHGFADKPAQIHRANKMIEFWSEWVPVSSKPPTTASR
jgi:dipeptidyl-peptidase-4